MREMRRKDREITDVSEIIKVVDACSVLHLGFADGDMPYVVPLNYGYTFEDGVLTFYFHSAREGMKFDIMERNNKVCFALDCDHNLVPGKVPCQYSFEFSSVVGYGTAHMIDGAEEKVRAMQILMRHVAKGEFEFTEKLVSVINVWCVKITSFTGKRRMLPKL